MRTHVVLLRGVMPIGKNQVPMAALREVLTGAGFGNVRTYIQSGNALVNSDLLPAEIERRIHDLIQAEIGPDLAVVVRTSAELQRVLNDNPFRESYDLKRVFFVLFAAPPSMEKVYTLLLQDFGEEKLAITPHAAYLYIPGTYGRDKLSGNFLEKQLGVRATMRNFNTLSRLIEMSGSENQGATFQ